MTETTEHIEEGGPLLFFDAHCSICLRSVEKLGWVLKRAGVQAVSLFHPQANRLTGLTLEDRLEAIVLRLPEGKLIRGFDALLWIGDRILLFKPVTWLFRLPLLHDFFCRVYGEVARRRYCGGRSTECRIDFKRKEPL
ncbi:MAG: hypothetical protein JWM04_1415 [Verrucomicrobiales bacterium]|nr:hypothetical protein [Verrucomicrobiales bacterium]